MAKRKLEVTIVGDSKSLDRALGRSEQRMKKFGQTTSKTSGLVSSRMNKAAKAAVGLAAGYASLAGAKKAISTTEDLAKTTLTLNKSFGLSVKTASQWAAVSKARGADGKAMTMGFKALATQMRNAKMGAKGPLETFKQLGISQKELTKNGNNLQWLLTNVSDGLGGMKTGGDKAAVSAKLFGRTWTTIAPLIRDGSGAMREQLGLADKYGATFGGKSVKEIQKMIAAQREAKLASLGLQVAFGTHVAPSLTKAINAGSKFVAQMRDGTGAGGEFAKRAKEIWESLEPVAKWAGKAALDVGKFAGNHPKLTRLAVSVGAVGLAIGKIKTSKTVSGISSIASGLGRLAKTKAGQRMKESVISGLSGLTGRLKGIFSRAGTSAGNSLATSAAGAAAGEGASAGVGGAMSKRSGKFRNAGKAVGKNIGKGVAAGLVLAIPLIISEFGGELIRKIKEAPGISDAFNLGKGIGRKLSGLFRREGGVVGFQGGGRVPAMLSSGELGVEPGGRAFMVPGRPVAADNVPAMVRPGTKIFTGHGQAMLASGASMSQALARQAPHFATGGQVAGLAARQGLRGRRLQEAVAISGAESGWNENAVNRNSNGSIDRGLWQINSIHGRLSTFDPVGNARAMAKISGEGRNWGPWATWPGRARGWMGRAARAVKGITGTAGGGAGRSRSLRVTTPAARSYPLLGNVLSPLVDDALLGGIERGKEGTGKLSLLTSILEGIVPESGDYATRRTVSLPGLRGGSRTDRAGLRGGKLKPGGGWAGTEGLVMGAVRGINQRMTFKRSRAVNGNQNSDHNTWIKNAFAADISPGGDSVFNLIARRLGIPARKGSWNNFPGRPLKGFRSQLLWHAPDGSHTDHVHLGIRKMRAGGVVGSYRKGSRGIRGGRPRRRAPSLRGLVRGLAGSPGTRGADRLTRSLSGRVTGRSLGALLRTRNDIQKRIRAMSRNGLTGQERIQVRRLRGALSLVEDELGRPIGLALGGSDLAQDAATRSLGNLENELIVGGIDPESAAGRAHRIGRTQSAIGALTSRRAELVGAMGRARATGNRQAIGQVQAEITEVDDQILGLRADLTTLSNATNDQTDAIREHAEALKALQAEVKVQNEFSASVAAINAKEAIRFMGDILSLQQGQDFSQRHRTASDGFTLSRLP